MIGVFSIDQIDTGKAPADPNDSQGEDTSKMPDRTTLLRPPPEDPTKSPIENVLEITELGVLGPDIFTNTRQPWQPSGARGIYGGAVIAQCLASAQKTVPSTFLVHSCHCYFLLAGSSEVPILFHVERVRDGRSFATRTVQARQRGRCIFTTTVSFVREGSSGKREVSHASKMPALNDAERPADDWADEPDYLKGGPYQSYRINITEADEAQDRKCRQWVRARGKISEDGGHQAHLNALAYISDSYFIGTVTRIHELWRFPFRPEDVPKLEPRIQEQVRQVNEFEGFGEDLERWKNRPQLGMIVSLDHSIYFHEPKRVRADEWMFTEMVSPWAGEGRGVVTQRMFARDGTLIATCVQEGVVRLKQDEEEDKAKL